MEHCVQMPVTAPSRPPWSQRALPWLMVSPALLLVGGVLFIPLLIGMSYAFRSLSLDDPFGEGRFSGLENFRALLSDPYLPGVIGNTVNWTLSSLLLQAVLGLGLALLLRHSGKLGRLNQALLFLPWAVPSVLIGLVWKMLLSPYTSPLPHWLFQLGALSSPSDLLADPATAMCGPLLANVWFGVPFFAITLLAALQAIPDDLYEAARLDGAQAWQCFVRITLPLLLPTLLMTLLLRSVWIINFGDLVWVMTQGGPANATQILPTYMFSLAFTDLNEGRASALAMLQLLLLCAYAGVILHFRRKARGGER